LLSWPLSGTLDRPRGGRWVFKVLSDERTTDLQARLPWRHDHHWSTFPTPSLDVGEAGLSDGSP
jgi:hypothetical protein